MQLSWVFMCTVCTMCTVYRVEGQRRQFLQDLIQRIKSSPKHQSSSPSWFGERQFEVIGTGRLPLQSHNLDIDSDVIERDIEEENFDAFYTNSDRRVGNEASNHENLNRYEELAVDVHTPSKNQAMQYLENPSSTSLHPGQQYTHTRQSFQGLGQLSQDREYFQGFQPSNLEVNHRPRQQQPDRLQTQYQTSDNKQYFGQEDPQRESYDYPSTFQSDSEEMFQENFKRFRRKPDTATYFGKFGFGWDQRKSRKKRSPFKRIKIKINNPFYYSNPSLPERRPTQGPRTRRQQTQPLNINRFKHGPQGFWDDADFDSNFFDRGHFESPDTFDVSQQPKPVYTGEDDRGYSPGYTAEDDRRYSPGFTAEDDREYNPAYTAEDYRGYNTAYTAEDDRGYSPGYTAEDDRGYRREQERQPSVAVHKPHLAGGQYANVKKYDLEREEENDILGSGNFYIEKGGTFYDGDEVPYSYSNLHPQAYKYYGNNNLNNFRDFADIKGDRLAGRRFQY